MTKRNLFKSLSVALGCAALVLFGIAADRPPRTVPVDGTFGTTFQLISTATSGVFDNPIQGVGNVPRLGICTLAIDQTVDFRTVPPTLAPSLWVLTFANGDKLYVSSQGTGAPDQTDPTFFMLSGLGSVTGGTGRFESATGELRFPGVAHVETPPDAAVGQGHGTFALEGYVRLGKN